MTTVEDALSRPEPVAVRCGRRVAVRALQPRRLWPVVFAGALILAALAVIAAVEVISGLAGDPLHLLPFEHATGSATEAQWTEPPVQGASVLLAVIGLALIGLALLPGRARWTVVRTDDQGLLVGMERSALRDTVAAAARNVNGVRSARVSVGRRGVRVRVRAESWSAASLRADVAAAAEHRLADLGPFRALAVSTKVRRPKR
ncbi:hypothetical protein F4561_000816 [Lipingzhangella halophila]|uniref:DUF6286 domain-containing protein n=1 Tax=Lipingzhangella halophila TaxID=1783352 RepID=A0A7W7REL0_9ACTN|nr:DUF6286 domain-containing protein [Lipingzhangella halophila]MBB4929996.1 hypothetical protein [Lipingzhangella halophila]